MKVEHVFYFVGIVFIFSATIYGIDTTATDHVDNALVIGTAVILCEIDAGGNVLLNHC
jgi:hypothetical protein